MHRQEAHTDKPPPERFAPVVVVGSGAAGLACALALAPCPVLLLTKTAEAAGGSSLLSQGGIAAALAAADSPEAHALDTMRAGAGIVDGERAAILTRDGAAAMRQLIADGFPADRDADGGLALGREGAHGVARIVHAGGDATGRSLIGTLLSQVRATPSIDMLQATVVVDLLAGNGRCGGLLAHQAGRGWLRLKTDAVVLATGGCGALWPETTNPRENTGDGLALAARAGAVLADLEFMQFHPTALLPRERADGARLPLLTEALRGAGARLLDRHGRPFMADLHPLADLASRDVVARAIAARQTAGDIVSLDLRPALAAHGATAFPEALRLCRAAGYDPRTTPVPITPAAHYHMGGIHADADGRSSLPGLWACGEVASTGVHGANRLASNSLLEALVWGQRAARAIKADIAGRPATANATPPTTPLPTPADTTTAETAMQQVRATMHRDAGIARSKAGLSRAVAELDHVQERLDAQPATGDPCEHGTVRAWSEARNGLLAARLIVEAARRRGESRGAHFRSDAPDSDPHWARRQTIALTDLRSGPVARSA